jgi:hypothetical protein
LPSQGKEDRLMDSTKTPDIPPELEQVRQELEQWRSTQAHRSPIPEPLWGAAAKLARQHGVQLTARTLRLDYARLKARVKPKARRKSAVRSSSALRQGAAPAFVELWAPRPGSSQECRVELEGPRGRMRVEFKGVATAELVALSRALWDGEAR